MNENTHTGSRTDLEADNPRLIDAAVLSSPADVAGALAELASAFDPHTAADVAPALTCREADALAGLLAAVHQHRAAQAWLAAHAESDEAGDEHFSGRADQGGDPADRHARPRCRAARR